MSDLTSTHLFSGGGGDLAGFLATGFTPQVAANHAAAAMQTVKANFPTVRRIQGDINNLDFRGLPKTRVLVGSPICKEASPAGGHATPRQRRTLDESIGEDDQAPAPEWSRTRATAWDLIRAAEVHDYDVVCGENVPEFATRWRLFDAWLNVWDALGYNIRIASVNAAHVSGPGNESAPQQRHRMVFAFTKKGLPLPDLSVRPECVCPSCGPVRGVQVWGRRFDRPGVRRVGVYGKQYRYACPTPRCHQPAVPVVRPIRDHIDLGVPGRRFGDGRPDRKKFTPYAPETRRKVAIGLERFGGEPFLAILRNNCTVQSLGEPISAINAEGNHHMLVHPGRTVEDCAVQMIDIRVKARAQRFADSHVLMGTGTEQTRQVGNAVPVNVAHWLSSRVRASLESAA